MDGKAKLFYKNSKKIRETEEVLVLLLAKERRKESESQSAESDLELKMGPIEINLI